jgi:GntR family transcriptional regulator
VVLHPSHVDTSSPTPIWSQIEEAVRRLVATGALAAGEALPSVRDCAVRLKVNPATVAKAYQRLVEAGVLEMRRGAGTFVSLDAPVLSKTERQRELRDAATRFAAVALPLGASLDEAQHALSAMWKDLAKKDGTR